MTSSASVWHVLHSCISLALNPEPLSAKSYIPRKPLRLGRTHPAIYWPGEPTSNFMSWRRHYHWLFVWIPLFGSFIWFGTLLSMLITWLATGRPKYSSQEGNIAYISDIGADFLKPLFVTGCAITGCTFVLSLSIERLLRHQGRLHPNSRRRERVYAILAILGSVIGGGGLLFLSIFDTKRYPSAHRVLLLVFMLGVSLAAIFTVAEYRWISKDYVDVRRLRIAYKMKAIIAGILILLAIAFGVALFKSTDVGAVLEWTIGFGYTFFLLTFYYDLRQAKGAYRGRYTPEAYSHGANRTNDYTADGVPTSSNQDGRNTYLPNNPAANGYQNGYQTNGQPGHGSTVPQTNGYTTNSYPMRSV